MLPYLVEKGNTRLIVAYVRLGIQETHIEEPSLFEFRVSTRGFVHLQIFVNSNRLADIPQCTIEVISMLVGFRYVDYNQCERKYRSLCTAC